MAAANTFYFYPEINIYINYCATYSDEASVLKLVLLGIYMARRMQIKLHDRTVLRPIFHLANRNFAVKSRNVF